MSAAYFVGKRFGKRKMFYRISPNKTMEGALASLATAFPATILWCFIFLPEIPLIDMFAFSIVGNALAQTGDLFESVVKRAAKQKDSGNLFYGHGGILDKVDGFAFLAPIIYIYLITFQGA